MIKKYSFVLGLIFLSLLFCADSKPDVYVIDASKNAATHNNQGLNDLSEGDYYGAIEEFNIAISLNPKTQATAVYYNNLGETYFKLGYFAYAQRCFQAAIAQYNLNFLYYQNLAKVYKAQNLVKSKMKYYVAASNKNHLNMIMVGLLYVMDGKVSKGITKLDEFCMTEPNLLITDAVRDYIKTLVQNN